MVGRDVVVCRSADQASPLSDGLAERGFTVIHLPLLEVVGPTDPEPLHDAIERLADYRWVAFTSTNAVRAVADVMTERFPDPTWPPTTGIAVVGRATERAVAERRWPIGVRPDRATATDLALALPAARRGDRLLAPLAELAGDDLLLGAQHAGYDVDRVTAYRTIVPPVPAELAARAQSSDAVVFTSPSIVDRWVDVVMTVDAEVGSRTRRSSGPAVVCIGPSTAAAAERRGLAVSAIADPHDTDGLIDAVVNTLDP